MTGKGKPEYLNLIDTNNNESNEDWKSGCQTARRLIIFRRTCTLYASHFIFGVRVRRAI